MANIDPELQRLEEAVRGARQRLAQVIPKVADERKEKGVILMNAGRQMLRRRRP
jgi:hypothetical protein